MSTFQQRIIMQARKRIPPSSTHSQSPSPAQSHCQSPSPTTESSLNVAPAKSHVTIDMMTSAEKSFYSEEDANGQEKNSETKADKKRKVQENERKILQRNLSKNVHSLDLRNWPIFNLLNSDFVPLIHTVMVFDNWNNKAIIVTKDKNVYSLGTAYNNDDNDLKTDDDSKTDIRIAVYPRKIKELCGKNIKTLAHSLYCVLILAEGEVYSLEFKKRGSDKPVVFSPTRVLSLSEERIVDIACGSCHCLALTSNGKVYAWGENVYGQVGNESIAISDSSLPRQVKYTLNDKNVISIACGSMFNMVLTDEGKLYGWGYNENGQISIDNTNSPFTTFSNPLASPSNSPKTDFNNQIISLNVQKSLKNYAYPHEITFLDKIVKAVCGNDHTLALTDKGKVYAWGRNYSGQVGVNNDIKFSGPTMVNVPENVLDIAAYGDSSVAVSSNKTIYLWGDYFGQHITAPFPTIFSKIDDAFVHSRFSAMHKPLTFFMNDYEYVEEVLNILESLGAAFDDPTTSDFTVQVEGQLIHVHKAILKIRCQYFKNKFLNDGTENNQSAPNSSVTYTVSDQYSYIVYKAFLKYLYTGTVDIPSENTLELMTLANEYGETSLKRDCEQIIKRVIAVPNVAFFYSKAYDCNAEELEEFCFQFALRHMTDVVLSEDYIKLDTSVKDRFMRRAAKENAFRT